MDLVVRRDGDVERSGNEKSGNGVYGCVSERGGSGIWSGSGKKESVSVNESGDDDGSAKENVNMSGIVNDLSYAVKRDLYSYPFCFLYPSPPLSLYPCPSLYHPCLYLYPSLYPPL